MVPSVTPVKETLNNGPPTGKSKRSSSQIPDKKYPVNANHPSWNGLRIRNYTAASAATPSQRAGAKQAGKRLYETHDGQIFPMGNKPDPTIQPTIF
jgi:hypothetical protein